MVPSTTDINGAGGVAARWREYSLELERDGWCVELWTVDSNDPATKIPRYRLANFPGTLTDSPGIGFVWKIWNRLVSQSDDANDNTSTRPSCVIMTDLFSNVPLALLCAGANVPLVYSIHTDIAQLDGINLLPQSAAFLQGSAGRLSSACVTTSPSFMSQLRKRGIKWCDRHYRPLPVDGVVAAAEKYSKEEIVNSRFELSGGAPDRPLLAYVGRWSAEKRLHLLKQCRPAGVALVFVGDGPMREVVGEWHDPPRVIVLPGMRPRTELALVYAACDWVVSASAFETFGNVPYEAAHLGTPALLQNAQGFTDQIDMKTEDRGSLLDFGAKDGCERLADALDRTAGLLKDPNRVKNAARRHALNGVTISQVVNEVVEKDERLRSESTVKNNPRKRRYLCLFFAFLWAVNLAAVLAIMKVFMVGFMQIGIDFTTGMRHQRNAKKAWRAKRNPSMAEGLDRVGGIGVENGDGGEKSGNSVRDTNETHPHPPPSPARVFKPWSDDGGSRNGTHVTGAISRRKRNDGFDGLANGKRRAMRM